LTERLLIKEIPGIIRGVCGFNKEPDEDGDQLLVVEFLLRPIDIDLLRNIFKINLNTKDREVFELIAPLEINEEQAKLLQPYVIDGVLDTTKYDYELQAWQDPDYDWSQGYPIKKS
jgi:hypothetical protein